MQNTSPIKKFLQIKEVVFSILVVATLALGTWLTIELIPINKSLDSLTIRVDAQEEIDDNRECQINRIIEDITIIKADTSYIRGFLDR